MRCGPLRSKLLAGEESELKQVGDRISCFAATPCAWVLHSKLDDDRISC